MDYVICWRFETHPSIHPVHGDSNARSILRQLCLRLLEHAYDLPYWKDLSPGLQYCPHGRSFIERLLILRDLRISSLNCIHMLVFCRCSVGGMRGLRVLQVAGQIPEAEQQKGGPTVNGSSMTPMFVESMDVAVVLSVVKHTALPSRRPFESVCTLQFQPQSAAEWRRQSARGIVARLASDRM